MIETLAGIQALWCLDPDVTFLNHGSFGACPRPILDFQRGLRDRMEAEPVRFLFRELEEYRRLAGVLPGLLEEEETVTRGS